MSGLPPSSGAIAQLAEDVGRALLRFADTLREQDQIPEPTRRGESRGRGRLQGRVLALSDLALPRGLAASEVAEALGVPQSNATRALKALADRGDLTLLDERPSRWRLAPRATTPAGSH